MARTKRSIVSDDEKRKKERERKRKYRESLKADNEKLEKVREYDRKRKREDKEKGKIKTIKDLNKREKRYQRKKWRDATVKYREKKKSSENYERFLDENTPPNSPIHPAPIIELSNSEKRKTAGQRRSRLRRERDKKEISKLKSSLEKAKKRTDTWRKKYKRLKQRSDTSNDINSPGKIAEKIIRSGPNEVRKNLIVGAALSMQLKENSAKCSSQQDKIAIAENVYGPIVAKKKIVKETLEKEKIISPYYQRQALKISNRMRKQKVTHINFIRDQVVDFFEDNENSCQAPGKKDYITRKKVQKQKRYLLFPIKELYKRFKEKPGCNKISYQTFIKIKPFWVVHKKLDQRDTCLCKTHANFKFKLDKLKLLRVIKTNSVSEILKKTVCNKNKIDCMYNTCKLCSIKVHNDLLDDQNFEDFNTYYYRWTDQFEEIKSKKSEKILKVKKTVKEKVLCTAFELLKQTNEDLKNISVHVFNMLHQQGQFNDMKEKLGENEAILFCDWSENYSCKYAEEVQSIHFGASRKQISLHTGVVYVGEKKSNSKLLFCSVSNSTNHESTAVWAHLETVLKHLKDTYPNVNILHFFTDGPTSQYRNKTNFFLMCKFCDSLDFELCSWNFWEAGHGKGPADGIGGLVKRTCDRSVAMGHDVTDAEGFLRTINHLKICSFLIDVDKIEEIKNVVKDHETTNKIVAVPGTMKLKCLIWKKTKEKYNLVLRRLTCSECRNEDKCNHYVFKPMISEWNLLKPRDQPSNIETDSLEKETSSTSFDVPSSCSDDEDSIIPGTSNILLQHRKRFRVEDIFSSSSEEDYDDIQENSFIVVKLVGKKSTSHYVAKVLENHGDGDLSVSFLRLATGGRFVFPNVREESSISSNNVVKQLKEPIVSRGRHEFHENLSVFKNLN